MHRLLAVAMTMERLPICGGAALRQDDGLHMVVNRRETRTKNKCCSHGEVYRECRNVAYGSGNKTQYCWPWHHHVF